MQSEKKYITRNEAAALLGCSLRTIERLQREPGFPYFKLNRRVIIDKDELLKWLKSRKEQAR